MGRKKTSGGRGGDEENIPAGKSKKKGLVIDDDEYSIATELSEESAVQEEEVVITGKKKGKKGGSKAVEDDEYEPAPEVVFTGKKKGKPKKNSFHEDNDGEVIDNKAIEDRTEDGNEAPVIEFMGKKKKSSSKGGKKTGGSVFAVSGFDALVDEDEQEDEDDDDDDDDAPTITFSGKKKSSKGSKKSGGNSLGAALLNEEMDKDESVSNDVMEDEDASVISFSGKKKSTKKKSPVVFAELSEDFGNGDVVENEEVVETSKSKKKKKKSGRTAQEEDDLDKILAELGEGPAVSKPAASHPVTASPADEKEGEEESVDAMEDGDTSVISFSGKKKSSKKKGPVVFAELSEDAVDGDGATEQASAGTSGVGADDSKSNRNEEVVETSKSKKKKKKSGRTAQEEDDLDKILAELGGPAVPKPAPPAPEENVQGQAQPETVSGADEKEGEEESIESAAAKKKKKKKEKEKEKKAAAAAASSTTAAPEAKDEKSNEVKTEVKAKVSDKKLPKHVREMQEALARRKEAEEKAKREEEEKRRKEEEERLRLEELERQAEEARRRKKEREKEKLLQKRLEGKILTAKQKEEERRRQAMREQFLANSGGLPDTSAPTKRPLYQKKKPKPTPQAVEKESQPDIVVEVDSSVEPEKVEEEPEIVDVDEKSEVAESVNENGVEEEDEDEDEWDAKSWDDVNLSVSAFADEEVESESEPVPKKELKKSVSSSRNAPVATEPPSDTKPAENQPIKSQDAESKKKQADPQVQVQVASKSKANAASASTSASSLKKGKQNSDAASSSTPKGEETLRSPICCIMGHVDTGKTKLLDCIRGTNVQEGEAGGITQQIGATYFPADNIRDRTRELKADAVLKVPGLLVIDTPGHESFTNLRSRGSGLCDIAILVVDIMHGLEPQTIESLNLLKMRNTEFIVALNKVDRLYGWKALRNAPITKTMSLQSRDVQMEFESRLTQIVTQFKEQGLNTGLYYKTLKRDRGENIFIVPTSAITGEGIPDLLLLLVNWTQKTMVQKLTFTNEVQCTVLEVKVVEGHGTTIDVVLVNGVLHEGDQIVVCGMQVPIVTTIRALLTPHPMKELRVKGSYLHHKEIKAAQGIKISAQGLEHAIAGTGLYVVGPDDDLEDIKEATMEDMKAVMSRIDKTGEGVCVQASTLGSLEALLEFLKTPEVNIPVSGISIGPVHKKDVMKASVMLEKKKEFATILAFDVKVTTEARDLAEDLGVKIFMADIIYHLFDQFKAYIDNIKEEKKKEAAEEAVFPCVLEILPNCIFNKKDPIVLGVDVLDGIAKVGTPLCVPTRDYIDIGRIASIENNHKPVDTAKKGQKVAIKIVGSNPEEQQKMFGRHFEIEDQLVSRISRQSIDLLKANYRDDLSNDDWRLVVKLKTLFKIQ